MTSAQKTPNVWAILSDTWRVISAQPRHFSALSILFLLPISIFSGVYPFLFPPPNYNNIIINNNNNNSVPSQLIIQFIYLFFAVIFGLCGGASITHTAIHGFYGEPVEITSALKSIPVLFLPLLATKLVYLIILWLIFSCYGILIAFAYGGLLLCGVQLDYGGPNFVALVVVFTVLLMAATIYIQVGWCLSTAVVVVESRWGYAPLKRSWYLVRGMRWVVFGTLMLLAVPSGLLSMWYSSVVTKAAAAAVGSGGDGIWTVISWGFVVEMIVCLCVWTVASLYSTVATTVLFIYCRAAHGGGGEEMAAFENGGGKFGREYAQVPYNDDAV
ncbi:hypothetical protein ABFS83_12G096700 [Erythranthe nasuta]